MESKYFTPDIEDLYIGYECEEPVLDYSSSGPIKEWKKKIIGDDWDGNLDLRNGTIPRLPHPQMIRTPFLTTEQIEKEGWVKQENKLNEDQRFGWVPDYDFKTSFGSLRLYITKMDVPSENITIEMYRASDPNIVWSLSSKWIAYRGKCPSINEFRKICKLIGI